MVILALTTGCDNVEWGGASIAMQPPPPATVGAEAPEEVEAGVDTAGIPPPPLPEGPVLYVGTRTGARVSLLPVFEFRGDTILPLTAESEAPGFDAHFARTRMAPGTEFTLFADGVRIGTLVAESTAAGEGWCTPRTVVTGVPELVPSAAGATRFLALDRGAAPPGAHAAGAFPAVAEELRAASLRLAQTAIMNEGALWPDDLGQARADLAATRLAPGGPVGVAATFMFRDRLEVSDPATPVAYALFVMGYPRDDDRHRLDYTWYRRVGDDGKGAPRFVQQFDWDGDGRTEVLLEVLGTESRWAAVLESGEGEPGRGEWDLVYEERCTPGAGPSGP